MVETALKLGRLYGVELEGAVSTGESLSVPENSYDFVYLANVIHHVHDRASLFKQVERALKPDGCGNRFVDQRVERRGADRLEHALAVFR